MQPKPYHFGDLSMNALELPVVLFSCFLALSTMTIFVGLKISASFSDVTNIVLFCVPAAILFSMPWIYEFCRNFQINKIDFRFVIAVVGLSMLYSLFGASINRPDIDDSIYVSKALYFLDHPYTNLDLMISWIAAVPHEIKVIDLHYYEMTQAAIALRTGLHFLTIYHIVFPAIAGFIMALSMLLLLSVFDRRKWACLVGIALLLPIILGLGETHMAFGNLSLARVFHAKYVFLSVMVPAWSYFSLKFLVKGEFSAWLTLSFIGFSMAGATSTALVFLPLLSLVIAFAFFFSSGQIFSRDNFIRAAKYLFCLAPLVLAALRYFVLAREEFGSGTVLNAGYPVDFFGQLEFLTEGTPPATPILFLIAALVVVWRSPNRIFWGWWLLLPFLLFLNPITDNLVMQHLFPEVVYWRLFYLLPFPIIVGIGFLLIFDGTSRSKGITGAIFLVALSLAVLSPSAVLRPGNDASLGLPGYKIDASILSTVKDIVESAPDGPMFAPIEISSNLLIWSSAYPQYHMREDYLKFVLFRVGLEKLFEERAQMYQFLYGGDPRGAPAFQRLLSSSERPRSVVLKQGTSFYGMATEMLIANGYKMRNLRGKKHTVFSSPFG